MIVPSSAEQYVGRNRKLMIKTGREHEGEEPDRHAAGPHGPETSIIDRAPEEYYAPLADLRAGDTRIYLGVVHNLADRDDYRRKLALAGRYLDDFGVAAPCGLGREARGQVPQLLQDHATALALLKEWRQSRR